MGGGEQKKKKQTKKTNNNYFSFNSISHFFFKVVHAYIFLAWMHWTSVNLKDKVNKEMEVFFFSPSFQLHTIVFQTKKPKKTNKIQQQYFLWRKKRD